MGFGPPALSRATVLVIGLIVPLYACGDGDSGGTTQPPVNGTVSGQVTASGAGVSGATLTLSQTGATSRTATSSGTGAYTFSAVPAGSWDVEIAPPTGFALAGGQAATVAVAVTAGQTSTADFALVSTLSSIRATVTAESQPTEDVTVRLFDADAATSRATQTTNASGAAVFESLVAADYDVEVTVPAGFELGAGEEARKRVTTTSGAEATVGFELEPIPGAQVVEVELIGSSFSPSNVTIPAGATVRWIYRSGGPHTVTPDGHATWTSATLTTAGQTFEHTFTAAGSFAYYCDPHRSIGMTGVVTVQ